MNDRWTPPGDPAPGEGPDENGQGHGPGEQHSLDKQTPPPQGWGGPQGPQQQNWSTPPGGGTPPYGGEQHWSQGPGGYGWNNGPHGWQQPQAAKPGVIPLRPLGVGEILDGAVSTARAHWRPVLAIALGIALLTEAMGVIASRLWLNSEAMTALETNPDPTEQEVLDALSSGLFAGSLMAVTAMIGSVLATAMLTIVVSRAVLGHGVTVGEAWADSRGRLLRLFGLVVTVGLATALPVVALVLMTAATGMGPFVVVGVLAGLALAVWVWVSLSLAAPALMLERQGVFTAMRRSWHLVTGSWWRVFGIQLLILLLILLVTSIVQVPTTMLAALFTESPSTLAPSTEWTPLLINGVGAVLGSVIALPLTAGVTALLYMDRRIRREALDLELARAAGLADPDSPPTGPAY
ncbi:DUF7544 domain-containing protein [Streptomyces spiramenti]|uniref:Glycerophosphoryl diester phosphodiesterase membrane domain-containing protein n=1 Tax=Streptomyces spiramenti TaxID=2720606 RepID=A0ABX1AG61_9ACTN|nr:hypothetical protein [Streptomyces spiramenti]NJP66174.1 hypothetical protein [Streptomyces spiramenti]